MSQSGSKPPSIVPTLGTATMNYTVMADAGFSAEIETTVSAMSAVSIAMSGVSAIGAVGVLTAVSSNGKIKFIDFGIDDAGGFWSSIVRPNMEDFRRDPTPQTAHNFATSLCAMLNWIWWDGHPTDDDRSPAYKQFCTDQISKCSHVGSVREIADAWKHRGLSRRGNIRTARTNEPILEIGFEDGTVVSMVDVFADVVAHIESLICQTLPNR